MGETDLREANPESRLQTDLAAPPPFVKDMLKANPPQTWEKMVLALEDSGLGPNRVHASELKRVTYFSTWK